MLPHFKGLEYRDPKLDYFLKKIQDFRSTSLGFLILGLSELFFADFAKVET